MGRRYYIYSYYQKLLVLFSFSSRFTFKKISYAFGKRMINELVVKALKNAYYSESPNKNKQLIFYTDLGYQYTSNELKEICKEFNITQSFSKKDCQYDNACIESFYFYIKKEKVYKNIYSTFEEANIVIFKYIEGWYNRKRLNSSINYMTPD